MSAEPPKATNTGAGAGDDHHHHHHPHHHPHHHRHGHHHHNNPHHHLSYIPATHGRSVRFSNTGMVNASQPQAAMAGRDALAAGGNAVDAAIATAAALTVTEPPMNGLGSDAFALVWVPWDKLSKEEQQQQLEKAAAPSSSSSSSTPQPPAGHLFGLNASGYSPAALTAEHLRQTLGSDAESPPVRGWASVTIPGAIGGWAALAERFGKLPLAKTLEPAIRLARNGFPVSPHIAMLWQRAAGNFKTELAPYPETRGWFDCFTTFPAAASADGAAADGATATRAPHAGEVYKNEAQARTLESIAASNGESFYRGELADKMDKFSQESGGYLRAADLAEYHPEWVQPISTSYKGHRLWEIPPNGQGIVALMAVKMMEGFTSGGESSAKDKDNEDEDQHVTYVHRQLECLKLAYTDGFTHIADPATMKVTVDELLSDQYLSHRRDDHIRDNEALEPFPGDPHGSNTVYLAAADSDGMMVSLIQSNYVGFGSGVVVPETGISLQCRGHGFSLEAGHPNELAPRKKPYHTIIPGFITRDRDVKEAKPDTHLPPQIPPQEAVGPFGVMGGYMQPQGQMQVAMNMIELAMNPQAALDAPRWQWVGGKKVLLEQGYYYGGGYTDNGVDNNNNNNDNSNTPTTAKTRTDAKRLAQRLAGLGHDVTVTSYDQVHSFGHGQVIVRDPVSGVLCGGAETRTDSAIATV